MEVVVDEFEAEDGDKVVEVDVEVGDTVCEACSLPQEEDPGKRVPTGLEPTDEQGVLAAGEGWPAVAARGSATTVATSAPDKKAIAMITFRIDTKSTPCSHSASAQVDEWNNTSTEVVL